MTHLPNTILSIPEEEATSPRAPAVPPIPEAPLVVIEPRRDWLALELNALWGHRELLYFLTWRDIKIRYKQTALGALWAILQPLLTMLIFTLFFGRLARIPSDGIPYPIFVYAGLIPWTFISNSVTVSGNSLVGNAQLITKVYFPRLIIPASAVGAGIVDFGISFIMILVMMGYYRVAPTRMLLFLPLFVLGFTVLATSVGMWLSALNVKYRDIKYVLPFFVQIWMYVTPIIYPASLVPEHWRWLLRLNPAFGMIEAFRATLLGQPVEPTTLIESIFVTLALFAFALWVFRRMEDEFADII